MVDFSHANSSKQYQRQVEVGRDVAAQLAAGEDRIIGVMVESNLNPGRQDLGAGQPLAHGVSITDACIGWDDTVRVLEHSRCGRRSTAGGLAAGGVMLAKIFGNADERRCPADCRR